jgi:hypothetical protein
VQSHESRQFAAWLIFDVGRKMPLLILVFAATIPVLWLTLFVRSHQLFYAFRDRYPEEAGRKIQHAFEFRRHPSKFFYFMSADSAAFLQAKRDGELLLRRRSVVRLSIASLVVPFGGMAMLVALIASGILR